MSHIVIHDDGDNVTQYRQFDDVGDAAAHLEELHNVHGVVGARLFALDEIEFAVRSYVKVEIGSSASEPPPVAAAPMAPPVAQLEEFEPVEHVEHVTIAEDLDTVEYVEAAMAPAADGSEEPIGGEVRRGLFGR